MTVNGRRVLITGAGGSLGASLALAFARRACPLILCDIDGAALAQTTAGLPRTSTPPRCVELDVSREPQVEALFDQLRAEQEAPDIVVNNAALSLYGHFLDVPTAAWRRLFDVNVNGALYVTRYALPLMVAKGVGHVAFISSLSGLCASAGLNVYAASKHALHGFAESLYLELQPKGVGVSLVCPSTLRSDIATRMGIHLGATASTEEVDAWRARRVQRHRERGLSCNHVAAQCLRAVQRGRFLTLVGAEARLGYAAKRILGRWYWTLIAGIMRRPSAMPP